MSEHLENINPSSEKLQQIAIPNADGAWQAMETTLDVKMPVEKRRKRRIWIWLIFLFLIVGGALVYFAPQSNKTSQKNEQLSKIPPSDDNSEQKLQEKNSLNNENDSLQLNIINRRDKNGLAQKTETNTIKSESEAKDKDKNLNSRTLDSSKNIVGFNNRKSKTENWEVVNDKNNNKETHSVGRAKSTKKGNIREAKIKDGNKTANKFNDMPLDVKKSSDKKKFSVKKNKATKNENHISAKTSPSVAINGGQRIGNEDKKNKNLHSKGISGTNSTLREPDNNIKNAKQKNIFQINNDSTKKRNNKEIDSSEEKIKALASISDSTSKAKMADSLNKKLSVINKNDSAKNKKAKRIGIAAGIGINQSFPINGQQYSSLNASGSNNALSDYLPVPMFRAYINKKFYMQLEAQINAPQYTKSLLVKSEPTVVSVGSTLVITSQDSGTIKKLFYFNIPLSVHYSPFKNFYIGTGLQFSLLTNGVGSFYSMLDSSTNGNSTFLFTSYKTDKLKNSSVFEQFKKSEWRFLLDANYQWKNLELGAKYNQAFNNFINAKISSAQVTQSRNSSIQIYVKYVLWKNKNAKSLFLK
jgi:hypothetical protein